MTEKAPKAPATINGEEYLSNDEPIDLRLKKVLENLESGLTPRGLAEIPVDADESFLVSVKYAMFTFNHEGVPFEIRIRGPLFPHGESLYAENQEDVKRIVAELIPKLEAAAKEIKRLKEEVNTTFKSFRSEIAALSNREATKKVAGESMEKWEKYREESDKRFEVKLDIDRFV